MSKEYIEVEKVDFREIYRLPNGKIYFKVDLDKDRQLHIQIDEYDLERIKKDCIALQKEKP